MAYSFEFWEVIDGSGETKLTTRTADDSVGSGGGDPAGAEDSQAQWHTVVRGDTLWELARRYGTAVERLVELNPSIRNPDLIYAGQKVRIK